MAVVAIVLLALTVVISIVVPTGQIRRGLGRASQLVLMLVGIVAARNLLRLAGFASIGSGIQSVMEAIGGG